MLIRVANSISKFPSCKYWSSWQATTSTLVKLVGDKIYHELLCCPIHKLLWLDGVGAIVWKYMYSSTTTIKSVIASESDRKFLLEQLYYIVILWILSKYCETSTYIIACSIFHIRWLTSALDPLQCSSFPVLLQTLCPSSLPLWLSVTGQDSRGLPSALLPCSWDQSTDRALTPSGRRRLSRLSGAYTDHHSGI